MKRKGFTLVELLAIIVVLGVLAVVATPLVLNTIEDAKKGAAKSSVTGYINAIENEIAASYIGNKTYEDRDDYVYDEIEVEVKGTKPTGGMYSLKNGVVTSGVFCVNGYEVSYTENGTEVRGNCTGEELKLSGSVKLSETSRFYIYPESGTFEVIENASGGTLTCTSDDEEVATCSIEGTTVTVTPGEKLGSATLTIKSEGNSKYKEASAAYLVHTELGLLSYTANDYTGVYDGEPHGIIVSSENAVIKYGIEEGNYTLTKNPTYVDVGEYTVYYEITKAGYHSVTGSKTVTITQAEGKVELSKISETLEYNETDSVEILENASGNEITLEILNPDVVEATIIDGVLQVKAIKTGTATIKLTSAATKNYTSASTEYTVTVTKANNTLTLSSNSGNYTYPEGGTFEITANTSGGALSCETSDKEVADCSINGMIVTVTLGTKEGDATLTIKSAETTNYNASQVAYVVTTGKGLLSYTSNGYTGIYDGELHGITVESSGATIKYGTTDGTYDLNASPKYSDVGEYTVYFEIAKAGYTTVTGSEKVTITKAAGSVVAPTAKTLTYTGEAQELVNAGSTTTGTIQYKLEGGSYSENIPTAINPGTYTVYYKVFGDTNHSDTEEKSIKVTINSAILNYTTGSYSGVYDKASHGITVISEGATIKYGTVEGTYDLDVNPTYTDVGEYTVYYEISREGYITVTGSEKVIITKANNTLTLSANSGSYTYPNGGTFDITANASEGELTCETSDKEVADCSIDGMVVTVTLGTKEGDATLTIKSAETKNYNAGQVAYVVTTGKGLLSYTSNGYTGVYDGQPHGITVESSGATIKYGTTAGNYTLDVSPTYSEVGEYTVYYQITKEGYTTVSSSEKVVITKADGSVVAPTAKTLTYTGSDQVLINAGSSSTGEIQYKLEDGNYSTNIPSATDAGIYKVYYKVIGDANHKDVAEASINVVIEKATGSVVAPTAKTLYYTEKAQALINAGSSSTGEIQYRLEGGNYSTTIPTATEVGTYKVYYKVVGDANHKDVAEASINVTITKANNTLVLSSNSATYTYPDEGTFTVDANKSGGKLACSSDDEDVATCEINGTTVTVTPGTKKGTATLTITSEETDSYNAGQAAHVATTEEGLLSYTASDYTGVYDGEPHGITVTASGATIKYGTTNGNYTLTSSPTLTDVGTLRVYFQITKAGYEPVTGYRTITITKANGSVVAPTAKTLTYTGEAQALVNAGSSSTGEIQYKLEGGSYSTSIPKGTESGTYKVYYKVVGDSNHKDVAEAGPITVTIKNAAGSVVAPTAKTLTYTGSAQALVNAGSSSTGEVQYRLESESYSASIPTGTNAGTYKVYYKVVGDSNHNDVAEAGPITVTIAKANNTLKLSSSNGVYQYPDSGTFTVETNTSKGTLSCTSSNESYATCSVGPMASDGTATVTVTPVAATKGGSATITVTSAETANYKSISAAHYATTEQGLLSVTANGYSGTYDGKAHGITVTSSTSGATIKYGTTEGSYTSDVSPTYSEAGEYTVYYQVTKAGYETITGNRKITINKAAGLCATYPTSKTLTYTGSAQALINAGTSCTGTIQYKVSGSSYSTNIPTRTDAGTYTVCYKVVGDANHNDVAESCSISVTIAKATNPMSVTASQKWETTFSTNAQTKNITAATGAQGTLTYSITSQSDSNNYFSINGTKVTAKASTPAGTYTVKIKATAAGNDNYNSGSKTITLTVTVAKKANTLTLSSSAALYTFPDEGTFEITANASGGTLGCTSSNDNVATCKINGLVVTVTPGTTKGEATLTITSAETDNYKAGQAAHVATTEEGLLTVTANDYSGVYDGKAHGITVSSSPSGATIRYRETSSGSYTLTSSPTLTDVGTKTVWYQVTKAGYGTVEGNKTITITQATNPIAVTASQKWETTFKTSAQTKAITAATGNQGAVTYTIASQVNASNASVSHFTISGTTVTAKASTPAGTYTVKITATAAGNTNYKSGSKTITLTVKVGKADHTLVLSSNAATYTYSDTAPYGVGTFTVKTNTSKGTLSCTSSNTSYATCSVGTMASDGTATVTVTPVAATKDGSATITVTSAATTNYNSSSAAHAATTAQGLISYTANDYTGTYDGKAHSITVTSSGSTIKYSTDGTTFTTTNPTLTNVGTQKVYYQISRTGYATIQGTSHYRTITITKATNPIAVTATQTWKPTFSTSAQTKSITAATGAQGTVSYSIASQVNASNATVSYFTISGTTVTAKASTPAGTYTVKITASAAGNSNYNSGSKTITLTVTVGKAAGSFTTKPAAKSLTYTGSAQALVSAGTTSTGTVYYKLGSTGTYSTTIPTGTNAGDYVVYYKITGNSNYNDVAEASVTVTIAKKANTLTLSSNAATYTYPNTGTFTVKANTSKGALSCKSSNESYATCSVGTMASDGTATVTVKTVAATANGSATITVTSAATANYKSATASHTATTKLGTLSVTANGYTGEWDGNAHSVTVTSSGATIKYSTDGTTYSTTKPTFTDIGTYNVWYQVSKTGYSTVTSEKPLVVTITNVSAANVSYTNSSVSSVTNVEQALDYLYDNLK